MSATENNNSTAVMEPAPRDRTALRTVVEEPTDASLMDPAHKALVEALRITYLLVRVAMWALVGLFLLSGFQRVNTGESGISLAFGEITNTDLAPGLHGSWPYPVGELVKVSTAPEEATIEFLPELSESERRELREQGPTALAGGGLGQLGVQDSYLLTADQAIAHAQWQLRWRRANAATSVQHVSDEDLPRIVQAAVRSAIVQAAATHTIDEILWATPETWRDTATYEPLPQQARRLAQEKLDGMDSGVEIVQLSLSSKFAPRHVIEDFNSVSKAEQNAAKLIANAQMERERVLTSTAGGAAETILAQIEQYERDLAAQDNDAAQRTFGHIAALLSGQATEIDGEQVTLPVSGRVVNVIEGAEQFKSRIVAQAQTDAAIFEAKLAAFKANPTVMLHTDWANAMTSLLGHESVQAMMVDTKGPFVAHLNRDPEISRQQERERHAEMKREGMEERRREMELDRYDRDENSTVSEQ